MTKTDVLFRATKGSPRTVEAIRARAQLQHRVVLALEQLWPLGRIMQTHAVSSDYVLAIAVKHGLSVSRPSDGWIGRP